MGGRNGPVAMDGGDVAELRDLNDVGVIPIIYPIAVADVASSNTEVTMKLKVRVLDAWVVKIGGNGSASNTYTVGNGSTAITDAMDGNINDKLNVRAAEIDDAQHEIDAGSALRVTWNKSGGNIAAIVYVLACPVPD